MRWSIKLICWENEYCVKSIQNIISFSTFHPFIDHLCKEYSGYFVNQPSYSNSFSFWYKTTFLLNHKRRRSIMWVFHLVH